MWCCDNWRRLLGQAFGQAVRCVVICDVFTCLASAAGFLCMRKAEVYRLMLCSAGELFAECPIVRDKPLTAVSDLIGRLLSRLAVRIMRTHHLQTKSLLMASWHALPMSNAHRPLLRGAMGFLGATADQ